MHKDGYLMHKYQPDRAIGSTWHPLVHGRMRELAIQEDETASVVFMIGEYYNASKNKKFVDNIYPTFIEPAANFMCRYIDEETGLPHASYDLWEEKFLTSTYTVCVVIAALEAASRLATIIDQPADSIKWQKTADALKVSLDMLYNQDLGYFVKGYLLQEDGSVVFDNTLDISNLYGPYMYSGIDLNDPRLLSTVAKIETRLLNVTPIGGVVRYENDPYFLSKHKYTGNPWIICTLWLAQYYATINKMDEAKKLLDWSLARKMVSGALSEQFDPETGMALSVTPLVWSHAEMVNTILDLSKYFNA
jgi:GH15 family glucan-1,4-alpha-glucosidase